VYPNFYFRVPTGVEFVDIEEGFNDGRGTTLFPQLPGQTRDPIYNTTLGTE